MSKPDLNLSQVEWSAVAIALQDAGVHGCGVVSHEGRAGPLRRLSSLIHGPQTSLPLPDPRQEAIRRFICVTQRRRRPAEDLADGLLAYGFSRAQIDAIALLSL